MDRATQFKRLDAFTVETPSWGLADSGTSSMSMGVLCLAFQRRTLAAGGWHRLRQDAGLVMASDHRHSIWGSGRSASRGDPLLSRLLVNRLSQPY